jgi:hypothetical protein
MATTPIQIPNIDLYTFEFTNNTLFLTPKTRRLTYDEIMAMSFAHSKIVRCTIQTITNANEADTVSSMRTRYRSVLIDIYTSLSWSELKAQTRFKVLAGNMYGVNGYQWCKELDASVQNKSATDTLREIVRLVRINKYSLDMMVELPGGETVMVCDPPIQ